MEWIEKTNPVFKSEWHKNGWENNPNFFGEQKEWNQTLITKINEISAHIHMANLMGGADTVEINPLNLKLIECFEYYSPSTNMIGHRYSLIIKDYIPIDRVNVYLSEGAIRNYYKVNKNNSNINFKKTFGVVILK